MPPEDAPALDPKMMQEYMQPQEDKPKIRKDPFVKLLSLGTGGGLAALVLGAATASPPFLVPLAAAGAALTGYYGLQKLEDTYLESKARRYEVR